MAINFNRIALIHCDNFESFHHFIIEAISKNMGPGVREFFLQYMLYWVKWRWEAVEE
jgi:hypothetical protein